MQKRTILLGFFNSVMAIFINVQIITSILKARSFLCLRSMAKRLFQILRHVIPCQRYPGYFRQDVGINL